MAKRPPGSIRELVIPIRRSVETFALRSVFAEVETGRFCTWEEILQLMSAACEAHDFPGIAEQDLAVHLAIIRQAQQRDLEAIWTTLVARIRSHFEETQKQDYADPIEIRSDPDL